MVWGGGGVQKFRKFLLTTFHVPMFWQSGCLVSDMTDVGVYRPQHLQSYCLTVVFHLSMSYDFGGQVIRPLLPINSHEIFYWVN
jgi:hypothetical protein